MAFVKEKELTVRSVITPLSTAGIPIAEDEITEITVPVIVTEADGCLTLLYTEQAEGDKTVCHVTVTDDGVVVSRRGGSVCDMHFGDGDDEGVYAVPPYTFPMRLHTLKLRRCMTLDGGTLDLFYLMSLGGDDRKVHLRMTVR